MNRGVPRLLSVVVPVRDHARFLGEQLASLADQDYRGDWEVVVADNGSSDGSDQVARARSARVVDASDRRGASHARNVGAAAARGDLLAFCDADNSARPGWLRAMAEAATAADVVAGRFLVNGINDSDHAAWVGRPPSHRPLTALRFMAFASGGNCAIWSDVFRALGGFDEELLEAEDIDLSWRAQLGGYRLGFAPEALMDRRCPTRLPSLVRQHWRWGRAGGRLARRYRPAGLKHGVRQEVAFHWSVLKRLPVSSQSRAGRGWWLGQAAFASGRSVELLTSRDGGSEPIQRASRPSSPS